MLECYCFFEYNVTFFISNCECYIVCLLFPYCNVINVTCECGNFVFVNIACFAVFPTDEVIAFLGGFCGKLNCFAVCACYNKLCFVVTIIAFNVESTTVCIEYC